MATIVDNYDWNNGDLIYGIGEKINLYIDYLWKHKKLTSDLSAMRFKDQRYVAINTYNRALDTSDFSLNKTMLEVDLDNIRDRAWRVDRDTTADGWTQGYVSGLIASKFSPATATGEVSSAKLIGSLQKGQDTISDASAEQALRAAAKELAIRRSCKYGVEYVLKLDKGRIHYVLDGMDMVKVAAKEWFDKTISTGGGSISFRKISICTTELRYLFRNWGRISKTGRVKYYYNYNEIVPPWTDVFFKSAKEWATYAEHLATKHLGATLGAPVIDLFKAGKFAETVDKYHELTPDLAT